MKMLLKTTYRKFNHSETCLLQEPLALKTCSIKYFVYLCSIRLLIAVVKLVAPKFVRAKSSTVEEFNYTLF